MTDCLTCRHGVPAINPQTNEVDFSKKVCIWGPPCVVAVATPRGPQFVTAFPTVGRGIRCDRHDPREDAETQQ